MPAISTPLDDDGGKHSNQPVPRPVTTRPRIAGNDPAVPGRLNAGRAADGARPPRSAGVR